MWTYVMAAARGDRLNAMRSAKRPDDNYSTTFAYNCRPMYSHIRSGRSSGLKHNKSNADLPPPFWTSAAGSSSARSAYQTDTSTKQTIISNNWLPTNCQKRNYGNSRQPHQAISMDDGYVYSTALAAEPSDISDDNSLYSPLMPNNHSVNGGNSIADTIILLPIPTTTTTPKASNAHQEGKQCRLTLEEQVNIPTEMSNSSKLDSDRTTSHCPEAFSANECQETNARNSAGTVAIFKTAFNLPLKGLTSHTKKNVSTISEQDVEFMSNENEAKTEIENLEDDDPFALPSKINRRYFQEVCQCVHYRALEIIQIVQDKKMRHFPY